MRRIAQQTRSTQRRAARDAPKGHKTCVLVKGAHWKLFRTTTTTTTTATITITMEPVRFLQYAV